jgi:hypothetical protein
MTAVEYLIEQMKKHYDEFGGLKYPEYWNEDFQQANELFEQQIKNAYVDGFKECEKIHEEAFFIQDLSEQYYNETYKPSA